MDAGEITIHVQPDVAQAYRTASEGDRRKMDLLVSLQLTDFLRSSEPLEAVLEEMCREARGHGLTQDALDSILND
jgi:hypothetical protein